MPGAMLLAMLLCGCIERLGRPERWSILAGHRLAIAALLMQTRQVERWIDAALANEQAQIEAAARDAGAQHGIRG